MGSRGAGELKAPRTPKSRGSSRAPRLQRPARGESRSFKGKALVLGSPKGWQVPRQALSALLGAYLVALELPRAQVTLQLTSLAETKGLNRRFRHKDKATDVLSFPALPGRPPRGFDGYLGDLALCLDYAWKEQGRFARDFGPECAFLLLHGLLHLKGLHHDSPAQERRRWSQSQRLHPLCLPLAPALKRLRPLTQR